METSKHPMIPPKYRTPWKPECCTCNILFETEGSFRVTIRGGFQVGRHHWYPFHLSNWNLETRAAGRLHDPIRARDVKPLLCLTAANDEPRQFRLRFIRMYPSFIGATCFVISDTYPWKLERIKLGALVAMECVVPVIGPMFGRTRIWMLPHANPEVFMHRSQTLWTED